MGGVMYISGSGYETKFGTGITISATSGIATFADGSTSTNGLHFGTGGDLKLYHNGTSSYIDNGTGDLYIRGVDEKWLYIQAKSGENSILCKDDGAVELYFDNSKKIETTNDGVVISGICTDSKGNVRSIPRNAQSSNYTLVASDAGKHIYAQSSPTITVPPDIFQGGDAVTIINASTSNMSINQGTGVSLYMPGGGEANCTLGRYGMCTLLLSVSNVWWISGAELSQ